MRAGDALEPGTALHRRYESLQAAPRGRHAAPPPPAGPLPEASALLGRLPGPWVAGRPDYRACYDYAVATLLGSRRAPQPGSGFVSPFLDSAFNDNVFWWDSCFITMFARLLHPYVPGICSLDNFYARQFDDGEICREINATTGRDLPWWTNLDGGPLYSFYDRAYGYRSLTSAAPDLDLATCRRPDLGRVPAAPPHLTLDALNHPVAAWAEWLSFTQTGDLDRLERVLPALAAYHAALEEHLGHAEGLYVSDWASMDNSPRNARLGFGVDTACEMVLDARHLLQIAAALRAAGRRADLDDAALGRRAEATDAAINALMWDPERAFYVDLDADRVRIEVRTIAGFWPLIAGVARGERADALVAALLDPAAFGRLNPVPSVAADEPGYVPEGGYWRGGTWSPTNQMVIAGLAAVGRHDLARELATRHLDAVCRVHADTGTIYEYSSPDLLSAGANDHPAFVGWSGMAPIGFLIERVIGLQADAPTARLTWRLPAAGPDCGVERYWFGGITADLALRHTDRERVVEVTADGPFTLELVGATGTSRHAVTARHRFEAP
ncbi:MGH1-like glycoside hydrolase domain-containing protein [Propioniciclava coleopterorum]|nr:trehalase family glycosidase [Propioniciclava coleopterorum]